MTPVDAFWHLLGFFAPAVSVGCISAGAAKMFWRRELQRMPWWRLALWGSGAGLIALVAGLLLSSRDGRMTTYLGVVAASALALWWKGFMHRR